jgi:hypothetical protein
MSAPDVVRASRNQVNTSTVWNIRNGRVRNIDSETIERVVAKRKRVA